MHYPSATPFVEIDLNAVCGNYRKLQQTSGSDLLAAVVKCDGYGLGATPISHALYERAGCRHFFVAYLQEAIALRTALPFDDMQIFVLHGPNCNDIEAFLTHRLVPVLNTSEQVDYWTKQAGPAPAALHIDTGMNRLGLSLEDAQTIAQRDGLTITVLMSHLACTSDPSQPENAAQQTAFLNATKTLFPNAIRSLGASGGCLMGPDYAQTMGRPGIALYGSSPTGRPDSRLQPVARLMAPILQIRRVPAGQPVGYDGTFKTTRPSILATIGLGYGDGFPRSGSNKASAYIGGSICPIAGRVSMDIISLDITGTKNPITTNDYAEFFGPDLAIDVAAADCGTIGYELLTSLGPRIERRYQ